MMTPDEQLRVGKATAEILRIAQELQRECAPANPNLKNLQYLSAFLMDSASQIMCIAVKDA